MTAGTRGRPEPAPRRKIAVTFDDLPSISVTHGEIEVQRSITTRLLEAITAHGVPAIGFVNERKLMRDELFDAARVELLQRWLDAALELGNHTFAHLDLHRVPVAEFEDDVIRGEVVTRALLRARGRVPRFFRHPYLHTGTDLAVKRRVERFLARRGYRVAPVSVYTEDYLFAAAYERAGQRGDHDTALRVAAAYVPYVERQVAYYEALSRRLLGYELPQILVLHANALNAARFDALATMLERRGYAFVPLEQAMQDPAYAVTDDYVGAEGISWLQRWALERGLGESFLDGEPLTPGYVRIKAEVGRGARVLRWWNRWSQIHRRMARVLSAGNGPEDRAAKSPRSDRQARA